MIMILLKLKILMLLLKFKILTLLLKFKILMLLLKFKMLTLLLNTHNNCCIQSCYCCQIMNMGTYKSFISNIYNFLVCSSTVAAILCQLPTTSNPKTVGRNVQCHIRCDRVKIPLWYKLEIATNHNQAYNRHHWVSTNQKIANHMPGKPDMLSQHASVKLDMVSWHAKCRQAIPTCIAKVIAYKGLQGPKTVDKLWESEEPRNWWSNDNNILGS